MMGVKKVYSIAFLFPQIANKYTFKSAREESEGRVWKRKESDPGQR